MWSGFSIIKPDVLHKEPEAVFTRCSAKTWVSAFVVEENISVMHVQ